MQLCIHASIHSSFYLSLSICISVECIKAARSAAEDSSKILVCIYIHILSNLVGSPLNVLGQNKATLMATQGVPKWSKGCPHGPKRSPASAQGGEKGIEGRKGEQQIIKLCTHTQNILKLLIRCLPIRRHTATGCIHVICLLR